MICKYCNNSTNNGTKFCNKNCRLNFIRNCCHRNRKSYKLWLRNGCRIVNTMGSTFSNERTSRI